jgi:hypothetical protein
MVYKLNFSCSYFDLSKSSKLWIHQSQVSKFLTISLSFIETKFRTFALQFTEIKFLTLALGHRPRAACSLRAATRTRITISCIGFW